MVPVLWSESPRDWQEPEPSVIAPRVVEAAHDGAIFLLHDGDAVRRCGRPFTERALPEILRALSERGIRAVTLTELIATGEIDAATR